ncbi:MAG: hypothetical protein NWF05_08060, partial [Candidatus Bathyarchaeota archaeon]|nr:hypothetical protein [Candidatus Bathyarchaeota archaeon]
WLRSSRLETESLRSARLAVNGVPYEDDEVLDLIQQAERTGAYKALHWLSFEFTDGMTVDDIVQTVQFALCCVGENLWKDFNNQYALLTNISKRVEQRKQEQKASC